MIAWHVRRRKVHPDEDVSRWPTLLVESLMRYEFEITKERLTAIAESTKDIPNFQEVVTKPSRGVRDEIRRLLGELPPKDKGE